MRRRFVLDVHLGKLARYLRMLGFDCLWRNDYADEEIIRVGRLERRIILTRDRGLLEAARGGYRVQTTDPRKQMREILSHFRLRSQIRPLRICLECNGPIIPVSKSQVVDRLPPRTREFYERFYICRDCRRVYWEGSHYERMMRFVRGATRL